MLNTCSIGRRWKPREGWSRPVLTGERGTLFPTRLLGRVSSCGGFFRWMARNAVSCGHGNDTGEAFGCSRPLSGSRTATIGIVAWFRFCRPILVVGRCIGFAVVMAQVRRPVPFRTRKLRPGRGDGTALERVWESSTPPHSTYGPSGRAPSGFPEGPFLFPRTGVFLHSVEVFGRRKDCRRDDSSSHWESRDAGGSQEFQGSFLPLSDGGIDWGTMHYFVPKRCVESNKIMYRDKATARQAADQSWRERGTELWVYRCEFCGTWHLTHRDPQALKGVTNRCCSIF